MFFFVFFFRKTWVGMVKNGSMRYRSSDIFYLYAQCKEDTKKKSFKSDLYKGHNATICWLQYLCKPTLEADGESMYSKLVSFSVDIVGSIPSLWGIDIDSFTWLAYFLCSEPATDVKGRCECRYFILLLLSYKTFYVN